MNKILILIIALIVIFGAFTLLGNKKTNPETSAQPTTQPTETEADNANTTVTLTNTGFTPKDITIKAGATVIWVNKSGEAATVNSDNHPTHLLYPFLNLGEFADGSSVQVIVEKAGQYSYHNHLNPGETGIITAK